jgi:hypothetical protein
MLMKAPNPSTDRWSGRSAQPVHPARRRPPASAGAVGPVVPRWVLVSAVGAPVSLLATATVAAELRASPYDPVSQTMSVLAATGSGAMVMTAGFIVTAVCQIVTAAGLLVLSPVPRIVLAFAGCCGLAVAALPVSLHRCVAAHLMAAAMGTGMLALWPVLAMSSAAFAPAACRRCWAIPASIIFATLLAWVCYEANHGMLLGLAERVAVIGETFWPLAVVATSRHVHEPRRQGPIAEASDLALRAPRGALGFSAESKGGRNQLRWYGLDTQPRFLGGVGQFRRGATTSDQMTVTASRKRAAASVSPVTVTSLSRQDDR